jgi:hypothetical protein
VIINDSYAFKNLFQSSELSTGMKLAEHEQEFSKFWLPPDFNMSPIGDPTHVKMVIPFQALDICMSTDSQASRMRILSS